MAQTDFTKENADNNAQSLSVDDISLLYLQLALNIWADRVDEHLLSLYREMV
jgi:hypothetical protein